jgi:hypothetical protein
VLRYRGGAPEERCVKVDGPIQIVDSDMQMEALHISYPLFYISSNIEIKDHRQSSIEVLRVTSGR